MQGAIALILKKRQDKSRVVRKTGEFQRVAALPRRTSYKDLSAALTATLGYKDCSRPLFPIQAWMLAEAYENRGLIANAQPGAGKCVIGSTTIFDGTARRRVDEMVGKKFKVLTKTADHQMAYAEATAFYSGMKECVSIEMADGSHPVLSEDHPVFTPDGWVPAAKLKPGDMVATPRRVPEPEAPLEVLDDEVILAAYLLSDGGVSQMQTVFTNTTPVVVEEFLAVADRLKRADETALFEGRKTKNEDRIAMRSRREAGETLAAIGKDYGITGSAVRYLLKAEPKKFKTNVRKTGISYSVNGLRWFRDKWGINGLAKYKRIPAQFWSMNDRQVALFLNRFWACDGYVESRGFGITLASYEMIEDLRFLLKRLGIRSSVHHRMAKYDDVKEFDAWRLNLSGADAVRFLEVIGPILGKEPACTRLAELLARTKRNTNYDLVPISVEQVDEICDEFGLTQYSRAPEIRGVRTELRKYFALTEKGKKISHDRFAEFCAESGYSGKYAWLADANIVWEKVEEVCSMGYQMVYDLSVPETGCFVGDGVVLHNTLVSLLLPVLLEAKRPLLLVPASLREKTLKIDIPDWSKDYRLHDNLYVMSYEALSREKQAESLEKIMPDLIIADETHKIRNPNAGVSRRVNRYFDRFPDTIFCGFSGTLTKRSLHDYKHLAYLALRDNSPLPFGYNDLIDWADAVDEGIHDDERPDPGALREFCQPGESVRVGLRRRIIETPGFVTTHESSLPCSLRIFERKVKVPPAVVAAMKKMRMEWATPGGEVITTKLDFLRHVKELMQGFYYRWKWKDDKPNFEWLAARKAWKTFARVTIKNSTDSVRPYDTEMQVASACIRGDLTPSDDCYNKWVAIRDTADPATEAVWIDEFMLDEIEAWIDHRKKAKGDDAGAGIVWVEHQTVMEKLRARSVAKGMPYEVYGAGDERISTATETCVASVLAHGTGRNLQAFNFNLFVTVMASGKAWEQAIARTHRTGQQADEVVVEVILPALEVWKSFDQARKDAVYVEDTMGQKQRLRIADVVVSSEEEVLSRRMGSGGQPDPLWIEDWPAEPKTKKEVS